MWVENRDDGGVNPVKTAILALVAQHPPPDLAGCNRAPHLTVVLWRMLAGFDDPVVLPKQLFTGVATDVAEQVVDVGDVASDIRGADDAVLVEGLSQLLDTVQADALALLQRPLDADLHPIGPRL